MADPFVAEIRIFAGNFAPSGWAFCDGQLMSISQNTALFSLLGTTYGGDGKTTFGLPDLRGRAPMHPGQGPGLTSRTLGERTGEAAVTLLQTQIPSHTHAVSAANVRADTTNPTSSVLARADGVRAYADVAGGTTTMGVEAYSPTGGGQPHNNMQPYLTLSFIIALQGVFPSHS